MFYLFVSCARRHTPTRKTAPQNVTRNKGSALLLRRGESSPLQFVVGDRELFLPTSAVIIAESDQRMFPYSIRVQSQLPRIGHADAGQRLHTVLACPRRA